MAFEKLQAVVRSGRAGMPASITLHGSKSGRPAFIVNLSKEFSAQAKIAGGDTFDLLIGTGADAGVIRLARTDDGLIQPQFNGKGGARFFCGHIEQFGSEARGKEFCAAELDAEAGTVIEITLPSWALE